MRFTSTFVLSLFGAATLLSATLAHAAGDTAADKAKVQAVMDKAPDAAKVWTLKDDGSLEHKLSGLVCPAKFPSVELWHLEIYGPPDARGNDVGCDYGRGEGRVAEAKLTVFLVKLADGETLDSVFKKYRHEVTASNPGVKVTGPALTVSSKDGSPPKLPDFRSEEYDLTLEGRRAQSDLIVSIVDGWVIEIRATHFMDTPEGVADSALAAFAWTIVVINKGGTAPAPHVN